MKAIQKIAAGLASIIALGVLTCTPVSADTPQRLASREAASARQTVVALNSTETPQELAWDMTYGELSPPLLVREPSAPVTAAEDVTDLSLG